MKHTFIQRPNFWSVRTILTSGDTLECSASTKEKALADLIKTTQTK